MPDFQSITLDRKLLARIFGNITISSTSFYKGEPCWEWNKARSRQGYACISILNSCWLLHRVMCYFFVNSTITELYCDHLCRVRHCINPIHLEPVTNTENIFRGNGYSARNARKTHCPHGHSYEDAYRVKTARICRTCRLQRSQAYATNMTPEQKTHQRQKQRQWRETNKEHVQEYQREYTLNRRKQT